MDQGDFLDESQSKSSLKERLKADELPYLKGRVTELEDELQFLKSLWTKHPMSVVYQMRIKTRNGQKVWVNTRDVTLAELMTLDHDDEIQGWIDDCRCPFDNRMDSYS
jgi:hypothetical protein